MRRIPYAPKNCLMLLAALSMVLVAICSTGIAYAADVHVSWGEAKSHYLGQSGEMETSFPADLAEVQMILGSTLATQNATFLRIRKVLRGSNYIAIGYKIIDGEVIPVIAVVTREPAVTMAVSAWPSEPRFVDEFTGLPLPANAQELLEAGELASELACGMGNSASSPRDNIGLDLLDSGGDTIGCGALATAAAAFTAFVFPGDYLVKSAAAGAVYYVVMQICTQAGDSDLPVDESAFDYYNPPPGVNLGSLMGCER